MTGLTAERPGFLLLLLLVPAMVLAWRRWPPPLTRHRRRLALALRLGMVVLLVLALADVHVARRPDRRALVAVVDLSDSARASQDQAAAAVRSMIRSKGADDVFGVVTFGREAQVELPPTREPGFAGFQTSPDPSYSNLSSALELAGNLIPDGFSRHVALLSDGRQNLGDASQAVSALRERSVRVDVMALGRPGSREALVLALEAPSVLRAGQALTVTARLRARDATGGALTLSVDGNEVEARDIDLPAGVSEQTFDLGTPEPGTHHLSVLLAASSDGYSQNNTAEAVVRVLGRPSVLLLEGALGAGANVRLGLEATGMDVQTRHSTEAPTELATLARFDSIVVADATAESFPAGSLAAIATAVRDLGRGLVATGGNRSYGPGGWKDTPLEELLPVRMEPRQPKEKQSVAVVLAMETMESATLDNVALGAAEAVVDQMKPDDELGVINMSFAQAPPGSDPGAKLDQDGSAFAIPLARLVDTEAAKKTIRSIRLGDPPSYSPSLAMAFDALEASDAVLKYVVLIGDGDAFGDVGQAHPAGEVPADIALPDFRLLAQRAKASRITVSAIGVDTHGVPAFMAHLRLIADAGGGSFFHAATATEVPNLLLAETRSVLRPWYEQDPFFPKVTSAGDLLTGVPLDEFPQLGGYVVTAAKATADVLLASPKDDPLLAAGQAGLGRTVAWTSDAAGRWTSGFLASPVAATLFGRMVAWSLPTGGGEGLRIDAVASGDGIDVTVAGSGQGGDLRVQVVDPTGATTDQQLRPVSQGEWQGLVPVGDVGTYVLHAVLSRDGTPVASTELALPVPYSPEYLEIGRDDVFLRQLAARSGTVLADATAVWEQPALPLTVSSPVFWLLLLVAAAIWPVDVAVRRLTLGLAKLVAAVRAERHRRRHVPRAMPEPVVRLRPGMGAVRRTRGRDRGEDPPVRREAAEAEEPVAGAGADDQGEGRRDLAARLLEAKRSRGHDESGA